jgi:hypothetical protein
MTIYAQYDAESGLVTNVVEYKEDDELELQTRTDLKKLEVGSSVGIGWTVNSDGTFTEPQLNLTYRELRRPEYPPLEDLADAIYWNESGDPSLLSAYVDACEAVKVKYPKP